MAVPRDHFYPFGYSNGDTLVNVSISPTIDLEETFTFFNHSGNEVKVSDLVYDNIYNHTS